MELAVLSRAPGCSPAGQTQTDTVQLQIAMNRLALPMMVLSFLVLCTVKSVHANSDSVSGMCSQCAVCGCACVQCTTCMHIVQSVCIVGEVSTKKDVTTAASKANSNSKGECRMQHCLLLSCSGRQHTSFFSFAIVMAVCKLWCSGHKQAWLKKCTWSGKCDGCSECLGG